MATLPAPAKLLLVWLGGFVPLIIIVAVVVMHRGSNVATDVVLCSQRDAVVSLAGMYSSGVDFEDAKKLAGYMRSDQLSSLIQRMQRDKHEVDAVFVASCAEPAKTAMLDYFNASINLFLSYMATGVSPKGALLDRALAAQERSSRLVGQLARLGDVQRR